MDRFYNYIHQDTNKIKIDKILKEIDEEENNEDNKTNIFKKYNEIFYILHNENYDIAHNKPYTKFPLDSEFCINSTFYIIHPLILHYIKEYIVKNNIIITIDEDEYITKILNYCYKNDEKNIIQIEDT